MFLHLLPVILKEGREEGGSYITQITLLSLHLSFPLLRNFLHYIALLHMARDIPRLYKHSAFYVRKQSRVPGYPLYVAMPSSKEHVFKFAF